MANTDDIRKTGPVGLKGLSAEQQERVKQAQQMARQAYLMNSNMPTVNSNDLYRYSPDEAMANWGSSKYDNPVQDQYLTDEQMQDTRYENQPWYDTLANGVVKMLGTAGTTFASSLVGMPYGLVKTAEGLAEGQDNAWANLWDNEVTSALADADKWMENNFTNYRSTEQQNSPWYSSANLFSMNFLADDIIKNAGFTLGAAASMAVGSGTLGLFSRAAGAVNKASKAGKMANNLVSSLFSATGEGMIEAKQGVEERNKAEFVNLENALAPEKAAIEEEYKLINDEYAANKGQQIVMGPDGNAVDPAYEIYKQKMSALSVKRDEYNRKLENGRQQIIESGREMGNKIMLGNQVLLTAGNMIQFSKLMNKSFDNARHAAEESAKTVKPSWYEFFGSKRKNAQNLAEGYEKTGSKRLGQFVAGTKGFVTEGSEEMNQQWIQSSAGAYYNEKDANDYWRAKLNQDAYRETTKDLYSLGNAINQGFKESWWNADQLQQFFIGGLTGMAGSWAPTKLFNQDKTKSRWDPRRYGEWSGGVFETVPEFNKQYNQYQENIEDLNKLLAQGDFQRRTQSLAARTYLEGLKQDAVTEDDKKAFKDADDKQIIHDIQSFLRAGKLDDLRAIYEEMGKDLSDEDVQSIIKSTTREISAEQDKKNHDDAMDEQIAERQAKIDELNQQIQETANPNSDAIARLQDTIAQTQSRIQSMTDTMNEIQDSDDIITDPELKQQYVGNIKADIDNYQQQLQDMQQRLAEYQNPSVQPQTISSPEIDRLQKQIEEENKAIQKLEEEKANYAGEKRLEGPYFTNNQRSKTDDEIREEVKHNTEEMQRKLDSYLDSVDAVNEATRGALSKDQEDNLAYLHNVAKEKIGREVKIISNLRNDLGPKFLFKTDKTPEQLSKETASSDLAFSKTDTTPEGYVEVDASLMDDNNFANFFVRDVLNGGNINREFGETADEKAQREREEAEDSNLSKEEKQKKKRERSSAKLQKVLDQRQAAGEQRSTNIDRMTEGFLQNYRKNHNSSEAETQMALIRFLGDIAEAEQLAIEAGEYNRTLDEYMRNPGKVDEDKKKEEEKNNKKNAEEQAKSKFGGKSAKEIRKDINSGEIDISDLHAYIKGVADGTINADDADVESAKTARDVINKQQSLEGYLSNNSNTTAVSDGRKMLQWAADAAENAGDITVDALNDFDADALISDSEADYMTAQGYTELQIHEQAEARKQQALNALSPGLEAFQSDIEKGNIIPSADDEAGNLGLLNDDEETGHDSVPKGKSNEGNNVPPPATPPSNPSDPITTSPGEGDAAIDEAIQTQEVESSNGGTWRNATRRYGRKKMADNKWKYVGVPYHETLGDKESLKYKRSKAIFEFLNSPEVHAFDNVENANDDRLHTYQPIRFRAKIMAQEIFGKDFGELTDQEQKDSIVIFMTDEGYNVLGDLPYPAFEPSMVSGKPTKEVVLLQKLYDKISNSLIDKYRKDGTTDAMVDGKEGLNLKFKDGKPLVGEVFEVGTGFIPYTDERKTLNEIYTDPKTIGTDTPVVKPFTLAIKVLADGQINIGHKKKANVKGVGKVGQSYVLIPDASGKFLAAPFSTPLFNAETMKDKQIYELLSEALSQLEKYHTTKNESGSKNKEERSRAIDTICALLQVESPFLDLDKKDKIVLKYTRIGEKEKQKIEVPRTDGWKDALLSQLSGTKVQISLRYINGKMNIGSLVRDYNKVIGQIAYTNLPNDIQHTAGSWFTLRNIDEEGQIQTKQTKYPVGTTRNYTMPDGRIVTISSGNQWTASDPETGEIIEDDEIVDLEMARMQAINADATKGFIKVDINGNVRKYDIEKNRFVDDSPKKSLGTPMERAINYLMEHEKGDIEDLVAALGIDDFSFIALQQQLEAQEGMKILGQDADTYEMPAGWAQKRKSKNASTINLKENKKGDEKQKPAGTGQGEGTIEEKYKTVEDADKAATSLGIVSARTKHAWNAISDAVRKDLMNGKDVQVTFNGVDKTLSINSIQNITNTLKEWNAALKRNPQGLSAKTLLRKVDREREKINVQKERRWLKRNLPMFNENERLTIISNLIEVPGSEEKAWGKFEQGVITLSDRAARGTLYHEAFHAVTQTLLSDEELNNLYDAAVRHYKETNIALIEEMLAEDFRRYVQIEETPVIGTILRFFRRIINAIRNIAGYKAPIHQLFYRINNGEFANSLPRQSRVGNAFYSINKKYYMDESDPMTQYIRMDGASRGLKGNNESVIISRWSRFIKHWNGRGYYPIGHWIDSTHEYKIYGIMDEENHYYYERELEDEVTSSPYQAKQAIEGRAEFTRWERLSPELQRSLIEEGQMESTWEALSQAEKDQWIDCHG